jgi:hypothetical protein
MVIWMADKTREGATAFDYPFNRIWKSFFLVSRDANQQSQFVVRKKKSFFVWNKKLEKILFVVEIVDQKIEVNKFLFFLKPNQFVFVKSICVSIDDDDDDDVVSNHWIGVSHRNCKTQLGQIFGDKV